MERLWTPWRKAFVEGTAAERNATDGLRPACFLCAKPADPPSADRDNLLLFRGQRVYVLLNLYPYNNGHLMIAPYEHTGDLGALDAATAAEVMQLTQRSIAALAQAYGPDGFNVGMNLGLPAGAGVPDHLHMHVVPRWNGDTNFMPVLADTKLLPESLDQTYDRLAPLFAERAT